MPAPKKQVPKAEQQMDPQFARMQKTRRMELAINEVVFDHKPTATTAKRYGVSRQQLHVRVSELKKQQAEAAERGEVARAEKLGETVHVSNERIRVPSFREFDKLYFSGIVCPDCQVHHETPDFHYEIIDALAGPDKRLMINVPVYHAKSTIATVKSTVYNLVKDPNSMTLLVSKTSDLAEQFLGSIVQWLTDPNLYETTPRNLIQDFGPFQSPGARWNAKAIYVTGRTSAEKDPSVQCVGVKGQIYGRRATRIIFDDIADTENQRSPDIIQQQLEWINKMALSRVGRNGKAAFIGTRVASGDIYSHLERAIQTMKVIRYPCIFDEAEGRVLWPDHFPISAAIERRSEMTPADWQLIYQQIDTPGAGASFSPEIIENCLDHSRTLGMYDPSWTLVAGLDPAGAGKNSGFTALVLLGYDRDTGAHHLVDLINVKSMKAFQLKDQILEWADTYPLRELRVEVNGIQSQLIQYDLELIKKLTDRNIRVVPHTTHRNKTDSTFGVDSMSTLFHNRLFSIPHGNGDTKHRVQPLIDQLIGFPMAEVSDLVMAAWFGYLAIRDIKRTMQAPLYQSKNRMPKYVQRRRRVHDLGTGMKWVPGDDNMPDWGRGGPGSERDQVQLVNVNRGVSVY
ncbi:MAG TPA: hypothetical protein VJQ57_09555 [Acidimicrobiia bacterium]|nr:hypothetical protein [Acidimicrobiia bacterium]